MLLIITFTIFIYVESLATHARYAGVLSKSVPMGITLHNAILSLNRFFGFLIAPQLALFLELGGGEDDLIILSCSSFVLGGLTAYISYINNQKIINSFQSIIEKINIEGYSIFSFFYFIKISKRTNNTYNTPGIDYKILFSAIFVSSTYYGVSFFMALFAFHFMQFRGTILQMSGILTGLGSLLLNFYVYPRITEMESKNDFVLGYKSLLIGKIIGVSFFPIVIIMIIYMIL